MKKFFGLICLILVGTVGWRIGETLSSDAISMALGVFFGVLAGIPAALLVVASDRRQGTGRGAHAYGMTHHAPAYPAAPPPVIVLNGGGAPLPQPGPHRHTGQQYAYHEHFDPRQHDPRFLYQQQQFAMAGGPDGARPARRFKVVGEQEEWIEEWQ